MKIGVFSDVHGNFIALLHCLNLLEERHVDKLYFLGDAVGYMPDAERVITTLLDKKVQCLKGNHEAMLLKMIPYPPKYENIYKLKETYKTMDMVLLEKIRKWPLSVETRVGSKKVLFLHGGLKNPLLQYIYPDSNLDDCLMTQHDVIFMGHTHRPFQRKIGDKLIVNVGSCGLPRDQGNLISFAIYESETNECRILRSYFDIELVLKQYPTLHEKVQDCLQRSSTKQVIGEILE